MTRSPRTLSLLLAATLAPALSAQAPERPAAPTEEATIQRFRAHAAPRPVAPQAPLSTEERNTIRRFKETKSSVVYVSAIAPGIDLRTHDITKVPQGQGTGFVWDEWGHIVTNHHIITVDEQGKRLGDVDEVEITLANGKTYKGRVIGYSFAYDIAVLQAFAPLPAMRPIPIGSSRNLQVGQSVMAIGNPFGLDHSLSKGVISALGREIGTDYSTRITDAIQTDAAVNPGNSGGPLLDSGGRLIGMNTAIAAATGASVGIGFAIPVDTLNRVVPRLIAQRFLVPERMGFDTLNAAVALKTFGIQRGLVVSQVDPDTPAGQAGIRPLKLDGQGGILALGDILLAYQGRPIESNGQLMAMLELEPPADEVVFDVLREGQVIQVKLQLKPAKKALPASI
ncbi:MAG TPA: 2-alkenal reductase [Holophagaceae bacterium]|nr:2-alkenal reductase [Holophagaceae bacterium]